MSRGAAIAAALAFGACFPAERPLPPSPPTIERFEASSLELDAPGEIELGWSVKDATAVALARDDAPGQPVPAAGRRRVALEASARLQLVADGPGGRRTAALTVAVRARPRVLIRSFQATPDRISPGETLRLGAEVEHATALRVRREDGRELSPCLVGWYCDAPVASTTYHLRVEGPGGPLHAQTSVTLGFPPFIHQFELLPPAIPRSGRARLAFFADADSAELEELGVPGRVAVDPGGELELSGAAGSRTFRLYAHRGHETAIAEASLLVSPDEPPHIERLRVSPAVTGQGGELAIEFAAERAERLELEVSGAAPISLDGTRSSAVVAAPSDPGVVRLRAVGAGGDVVERSAPVDVRPELPVIRALWTSIGLGGETVVHFQVERAERVRVSGRFGEIVAPPDPPEVSLVSLGSATVDLRFAAENAAGETVRFLVR